MRNVNPEMQKLLEEKENMAKELAILKLDAANAGISGKPNKLIFMPASDTPLSESDLMNIQKKCKNELKNLFGFMSKRKRTTNKKGYSEALVAFKHAVELVSIEMSGNRWLLDNVTFHEIDRTGKPDEMDSLSFSLSILGHIRPQGNGKGGTFSIEESITPKPIKLFLSGSFHRYGFRIEGEYI